MTSQKISDSFDNLYSITEALYYPKTRSIYLIPGSSPKRLRISHVGQNIYDGHNDYVCLKSFNSHDEPFGLDSYNGHIGYIRHDGHDNYSGHNDLNSNKRLYLTWGATLTQ